MKCVKCFNLLPDGAAYCPTCGAKQSPSARTQKTKSRGNGQGSAYKRGKGWQAACISAASFAVLPIIFLAR